MGMASMRRGLSAEKVLVILLVVTPLSSSRDRRPRVVWTIVISRKDGRLSGYRCKTSCKNSLRRGRRISRNEMVLSSQPIYRRIKFHITHAVSPPTALPGTTSRIISLSSTLPSSPPQPCPHRNPPFLYNSWITFLLLPTFAHHAFLRFRYLQIFTCVTDASWQTADIHKRKSYKGAWVPGDRLSGSGGGCTYPSFPQASANPMPPLNIIY